MNLLAIWALWSFIFASAMASNYYDLLNLVATQKGYQGDLIMRVGMNGPYGNDIQKLKLEVFSETKERVHIKVTDPAEKRWEVPGVVLAPETTAKADQTDYEISFSQSPFGITITRASTGEILFSTLPANDGPQFNGLIFENQYIEFSTQLPQDPNIYGLGERVHAFRLDPNYKHYPIWNLDQGTPVDVNLYGSHAFYTDFRLDTRNSHGVFLLNSNAMDVFIQPGALTYRVTGGVIDLYIFTGPNAESVIQQYSKVIGTPAISPYWSLGFHQCRWGYKNLDEVKAVVDNYAHHNIPLDAMWNDIDYMNGYRDFTYDPVNYPQPQVKAWVDSLHAKGMKYVIITDPGIKVDPSYSAYNEGLQMDIYIKDRDGKTPIQSQVWPSYTVFPDFTNPLSHDYWYNQINNFHTNGAPFDGIWIDMNEIVGFCDGACYAPGYPTPLPVPTPRPGEFNPDFPPFVPARPMDDRTLNMSAILKGGINYNLHNMYGFLETVATRKAMDRVLGKRPLIVSRSTYPGQGHYGTHWLGDNTATWDDLYYSISGIFNFQLFGIPHVGADICGFNGQTTEELCIRWMELGAFYPFSRNHYAIDALPHEPYKFGPALINASRTALHVRYTLLPYYYAQLAHIHMNGGSIMRPLFFEFANDTSGYIQYFDRQFLIGPGLLVSPVLEKGATSVNAYFPDAIWYDYYTGHAIYGPTWVTLPAPLEHINVHVRGGTIIPTQEPALTTAAARKNPYGLIVAFDKWGQARGHLHVDDGESLDSFTAGLYTGIHYVASDDGRSGRLNSQIVKNEYAELAKSVLGSIRVLGVSSACVVTVNGSMVKSYTFTNNVLTIAGLSASMADALSVTWSC